MHLSRPLRYRDRRTRRVRHHFLVPTGSRVRLSAIVLLITRDRNLTKRLISSISASSEGALTILCVNSLPEATHRLDLNDSIDAVILDCDLAAARDFESLHLLLDAAPDLPIIVLGDDPSLIQQMSLVEHGAQDYLLKRRLNAETLVSTVYIAIARNYRHWILFCEQAQGPTVLRNLGDTS